MPEMAGQNAPEKPSPGQMLLRFGQRREDVDRHRRRAAETQAFGQGLRHRESAAGLRPLWSGGRDKNCVLCFADAPGKRQTRVERKMCHGSGPSMIGIVVATLVEGAEAIVLSG